MRAIALEKTAKAAIKCSIGGDQVTKNAADGDLRALVRAVGFPKLAAAEVGVDGHEVELAIEGCKIKRVDERSRIDLVRARAVADPQGPRQCRVPESKVKLVQDTNPGAEGALPGKILDELRPRAGAVTLPKLSGDSTAGRGVEDLKEKLSIDIGEVLKVQGRRKLLDQSSSRGGRIALPRRCRRRWP